MDSWDFPFCKEKSPEAQECPSYQSLWRETCGDIKVQLVLQFGVSRGLREVLLAPVGRVYLSEIQVWAETRAAVPR